MDKKIVALLEASFSERRFYQNDFYRFRRISETEVELARLVTDPCGGTVPSPQITFLLVSGTENFVPVKLVDLGKSPTERLTAPDNQSALTEAAQGLLAIFMEQVS